MNDPIKEILRLIKKGLMITEVSYEAFQERKTLIIDAVSSPAPYTCRNCGSTVVGGSGKVIVVKNGKRETIVHSEQYDHMPLVICLKKQCYIHKNCRTHQAAQSYLVQPRHSVANHVRYKTASLLTEKISLSFTVKNCQVSLATVIYTLKESKSYLPKQSKRILPKILMVDEFRPHAPIEDKMNSVYADDEIGQLIDTLPTHKLPRLTSYFLDCASPEEVKFLIIGTNITYSQLTKHILPNAEAVIDRFHIIRHMNQAFNELRIHEINELRKVGQKGQAEKLKRNQRFLLKNRANISRYGYKTREGSQAPEYPFLTEATVTDRLLGFSTSLKKAYPCLHGLAEAF